LLIDAVIDRRPRKLVAQPTKQSYLYVFDRITGQPIWPMPETAVPQTDVPGEKTSPTQPIPSKPPAYSRPFVGPDDVIDFTPQLHATALENLKKYRWEPTPFIPGTMGGKQWLGAINIGNTVGGINWPGASFDPETATFYGQANNSASAGRRSARRTCRWLWLKCRRRTGFRSGKRNHRRARKADADVADSVAAVVVDADAARARHRASRRLRRPAARRRRFRRLPDSADAADSRPASKDSRSSSRRTAC
jgi:hypothetical protein